MTRIPELSLTEAELASWARVRIHADIEQLIGLAVHLGIFERGERVRPAIDCDNGIICLGHDPTKTVYALAPSDGIVAADGLIRRVGPLC